MSPMRLCLITLLAMLAGPASAGPPVSTVSLGNAGQFAVLSTSQPVTLALGAQVVGGLAGGSAVTLAKDASIQGDAVANTKGITLKKDASVSGACVTAGAPVVLKSGASCGSQDTSGTGADLTTQSYAIADLATFETALAGLSPTQAALGDVVAAKNQTVDITDTVSGGLNVVSATSITLKPGAALKLHGAGGAETLVLEISGNLVMKPGSTILLAGLTASQVIIHVGGSSVKLPKSAQVPATLVVPHGGCALGPDCVVTGAVLCLGKVSLAKDAQVNFTPYAIPLVWSTTGDLNIGRSSQTQTSLPSGQVLVTGGFSTGNTKVETTAEVYDALGATATPTAGDMGAGRAGHTATLLLDGTVLIAGGQDISNNMLVGAEIYDPATGLFTPTGDMGVKRAYHTATLLASGKVLVAGGDTASLVPNDTAELYDPAAGTFSGAGTMSVARDYAVAGLFTTGPLAGKVIVAGGNFNGGGTASADLYDPVANVFTPTGAMSAPRVFAQAAMLGTGKFLVAGGDSDATATAELYDPVSGTFSPTGSMVSGDHRLGAAVVLSDGKVDVIGGQTHAGFITTNTDVYNPATGTFSLGQPLNQFRQSFGASSLGNGQVLVTGGFIVGTDLASAELLH